MTIDLWIVKCRKCGRDVDINGMLLREGRCSPADWGRCIREPREPEYIRVYGEPKMGKFMHADDVAEMFASGDVIALDSIQIHKGKSK